MNMLKLHLLLIATKTARCYKVNLEAKVKAHVFQYKTNHVAVQFLPI